MLYADRLDNKISYFGALCVACTLSTVNIIFFSNHFFWGEITMYWISCVSVNGSLNAFVTKPNLVLCVCLLVCLFVYPCATRRSGSCPSQLLQVLPVEGSTAHHRLFGSSASSGSQRIKHKEQRPNVVVASLAHFARLVASFFHCFLSRCSLLHCLLETVGFCWSSSGILSTYVRKCGLFRVPLCILLCCYC